MVLTKKQRSLLPNIDALVETMGLSPKGVLEDWKGDSAGITAHLTRITEHLVRAEVIGHYTYVDEILGMELHRHFFRGSRSRRGSRRWKTLWALMPELYPLQKIRVIRTNRSAQNQLLANNRCITINTILTRRFMERVDRATTRYTRIVIVLAAAGVLAAVVQVVVVIAGA